MKYKIAAILLIIQGGLFELFGSISGLILVANPLIAADLQSQPEFIVPYFNAHMDLIFLMGGIYGIVRIIGAIGLLKKRMWGLVLSVINCVVTMAVMMFMLPAGFIDGICSCTALILILMQYFGKKTA